VIISIDTECTGLDLAHGAMPFLVTSTEVGKDPIYWEWPVDPLTRKPEIPDGDLADIAELIDAADLIYLQNAKFDCRALLTIGIQLPWPKVRDTLIMGHLLASNHGHRLEQMCVEYLDVDIEPFELAVKEVTQACRTIVKRDYPHWKIADEGVLGMPSVKSSSKRDEDKPWKNDMWLPHALAKEKGRTNSFRLLPDSDVPNKRWLEACSRYANADSEHTLYLGLEMERLIRERGYWKIYEERLKLPRVDCEMEDYGITAIGEYTEATIQQYGQHVAEIEDELVSIAKGYGHKLELAKGAAINDNMRDFFYGMQEQWCMVCPYKKRVKHWAGEHANGDLCPKCSKRKRCPNNVQLQVRQRDNLRLPVIYSKKKGAGATLDGDAMKEYLGTTDGTTYDFIELLADKRMYDTALSYMEAYRRFWVPVKGVPGYYRIHCSINPCATDHLRQASNSPNMQNVSGESKEISNRACFGPLPDREWWRMDFKSIENRIPAYESGQEEMIELFEKPDEPPFFGSYYLLNASITCPDIFWPLAEHEGAFKREQPLAYKHVKFGTLAMQYGCGEAKADKLFRMTGAFRLLKDKLPKLTALQQHYLAFAEKYGYVETIPDKSVDPERGYPILASRTDDGRVLSTTPFNYHVSGTACWVKNRALVKCSDQLATWREDGFDGCMSLEVHDDILFDFPRGDGPDTNLERAMALRELMEEAGDGIGIPTPVSVSYHDTSWAKEVTV